MSKAASGPGQTEGNATITQSEVASTLDKTEIGIWRWNFLTDELVWDSVMRRLFQIPESKETLTYEDFIDRVHPGDRDQIQNAVTASLDTLEDYTAEYRVALPDGSIRYISARGAVLRDDDTPTALMGICVDMTKQKTLEAELKSSRDRLDLAVQASTAGLWDWPDVTKDEAWFSRHHQALLGYKDGELEPSYSAFLKHLHRADSERMSATIRAHLENEIPYAADYRLRTKSGEYRWFRVRGRATRNGTVTRMSGSIIDIHDQRKAEQALRMSESRFRALADHVPGLFAYVNQDLVYEYVNEEFESWFGMDPDSYLGKHVSETADPSVYMRIEPRARRALGGETVRFEDQVPDPIQGTRYVSGIYQPDIDERGNIRGFYALINDVSAVKRAEERVRRQAEELARSNRDLEDFAYVASHDLKAPLRSISALVGWVLEDLEGQVSEETEKHLVLIDSRTKRLERLLDDLLAFSRAGRPESRTRMVDIEELIRGAVETAGVPDVFTIELDVPVAPLLTAPAPLELILRNLVSNVVKHHDAESGCIHVSVADAGEHLEFSIADDGPGIEERFQEKIFQLFQTLKPRDRVEGSGMGLALVRRLVEWQGGQVRVESQTDTRGSTFVFTWRKDWSENNEPYRLCGSGFSRDAAGRS